MQFLLTEIGIKLGYDIFVAINDRTIPLDWKNLEFTTIPELPPLNLPKEVLTLIRQVILKSSKLLAIYYFISSLKKIFGF